MSIYDQRKTKFLVDIHELKSKRTLCIQEKQKEYNDKIEKNEIEIKD